MFKPQVEVAPLFHLGHFLGSVAKTLCLWVETGWDLPGLWSWSQRQCRSQRSIPFPNPSLLCLFSDNGRGGPKLWAWLTGTATLVGWTGWLRVCSQGLPPGPDKTSRAIRPGWLCPPRLHGACVQRWLQGFIQVLNFPAVWFCQHPHLREVASIFNRPPVPRRRCQDHGRHPLPPPPLRSVDDVHGEEASGPGSNS